MSTATKIRRRIPAIVLGTAMIAVFAQPFEAVTEFLGTDFVGFDAPSYPQANAAYAGWLASVGGTSMREPMDGLAGNPGFDGFLATHQGNVFNVNDAVIQTTSCGGCTTPALLGNFLYTDTINQGHWLNWSLARASDAFGFCVGDTDGASLTVIFGLVGDPGGPSAIGVSIPDGENSTTFWGVSGLPGFVDQVFIHVWDENIGSNNVVTWHNFVYTPSIPLPAGLPLLLGGLGVIGLAGIRKRPRS